jgi:hypothetical protein
MTAMGEPVSRSLPSISTTMSYYVDMDADEMAGDLWAKFGTPETGNIFGNTRQETTQGAGVGNNT